MTYQSYNVTIKSHDLLVIRINERNYKMPKETFINLNEEKQENIMRSANKKVFKPEL